MSAPTTPSAPADGGGAAPARASPASRAPSPPILTPGRKIRQLMAQFDDSDSDAAGDEQATTRVRVPGSAQVSKTPLAGAGADHGMPGALDTTSKRLFGFSISDSSDAADENDYGGYLRGDAPGSDDDEDDEDDVFRPKGRMAAKLLPHGAAKPSSPGRRSPRSPDNPAPADAAADYHLPPTPSRPMQQIFQSSSQLAADGELFVAQSPAGSSQRRWSFPALDSEDDSAPPKHPLFHQMASRGGTAGADADGDPTGRVLHHAPATALTPGDDDDDDDVAPIVTAAAKRAKATKRATNRRSKAATGKADDNGTSALATRKRQPKTKRVATGAEISADGDPDKQGAQEQSGNGDLQLQDDAMAESSDDMPNAPGRRQPRRQTKTKAKKLTKKELAEMHRQTQRLRREYVWETSYVPPKKYTVEDFVAKFTGSAPAEQPPENTTPVDGTGSRDGGVTSPAAAPAAGNLDDSWFDAEALRVNDAAGSANDTSDTGPGTSVPVGLDMDSDKGPHTVDQTATGGVEGMPETAQSVNGHPAATPARTTKTVRVHLSKEQVEQHQDDGGDDDLEIITDTTRARPIALFENMPIRKRQQEMAGASSIHQLRILAQVPSQPPRTQQGEQSLRGLELDLWRRAREQAEKEREERIAALRAKGVVIETAEERARMEDDVEDLLEKARAEVEELRKKEKTERGEDGEADALGDDDEEFIDDDNDGSDEETDSSDAGDEDHDGGDSDSERLTEASDIVDEIEDGTHASDTVQAGTHTTRDLRTDGSANADTVMPEQADGGSGVTTPRREMGSDQRCPPSGTPSHSDSSDVNGNTLKASAVTARRTRKAYAVIDDDDDDDDDDGDQTSPPANGATGTGTIAAISSKSPDIASTAAPILPAIGTPRRRDDAELSLSQAFMDTLVEGQPAEAEKGLSGVARLTIPTEVDEVPLPLSPRPVESPFRLSVHSPVSATACVDKIQESPNVNGHTIPQTPTAIPPSAESPAGGSVSRFSMAPTPTQDRGFVYSPYRSRGLSVQSSVPPEETVGADGKRTSGLSGGDAVVRPPLRRGVRGQVEPGEQPVTNDTSTNAFDELKKQARRIQKRRAQFNKERSEAKEIIDEAAIESDDEYAGLGGRSDDSEGEEDEDDVRMIDDNEDVHVDEAQLAALNADHIRTKDEAAVSKLFKDITTGALRRRRVRDSGRGVDLSDSDDEQYAARRRAKRREYEKMRRALLMTDEKVGQIAEDPKKVAFLRSLEETTMDDTDGSLDVDEEWDGHDISQDSTASTTPPPADNDASPADRSQVSRSKPTRGHRQPRSRDDIKRALSAILGEPETPPPLDSEELAVAAAGESRQDEQVDLDSGSDDELASPFAERSTADAARKPSEPTQEMVFRSKYVNRWSLRRTASINAAVSQSRPAFAAPGGSNGARRPLALGSRRVATLAPDSQTAEPSTTTTTTLRKPIPRAVNVEKASSSHYAASRKRQREYELQHAAGAAHKPRKLTAAIAAARSGQGLHGLAGNKGFET